MDEYMNEAVDDDGSEEFIANVESLELDEENIESIDDINLPPQRRCMSHLLNLISRDFQKDLSNQANQALVCAMSKIQSLGNFIHRSSRAKTICLDVIGCVLPIPCITRWNSRYDAIAKACSDGIKQKMNTLIQRLSAETANASHLQMVTNADWKVLNEYIRVMKPIAISLDILQGDEEACQGYIAPTLSSMIIHISTLSEATNPILQAFKKSALRVLKKRFDQYIKIDFESRDIVLAALSHPKFKTTYIEKDEDERKAREFLKNECMKYINESNVSSEVQPHQTEGESNGFFISFQRSDARRGSIEHDVDEEVSRYLNDDRKNLDMLNQYPTIKRIFFQYNTTLSSSTPIERVFSQCKLIFRPQRNRLSAANFERAIFLKINSKHFQNKD